MHSDSTSGRFLWSTSKRTWLLMAGQLLLLVVAAATILWPAPIDPNQLFAAIPRSDLIYSQWPFALLIQRALTQGHGLPFWNPYIGGGLPVAADPLAALFYPPTLLVAFLPLRTYFLVIIMAHLVFAGLGTLLLARRVLKLPMFPAFVAAIAFMATPRLISHLGAGHVTVVQTVCWYPWLALACWATVRDPRRWGALLGVCFGMILLAGHPQMAYYGLLMVAGLVGWFLLNLLRAKGWRSLQAPVVGLLVAGLLGAMLAAIHLLPVKELTAFSTRQISVKSGDAYPFGNFLYALFVQSPPFKDGHTIDTWEGFVSPGPAILALAFFGMISRWRKAWPLVLGIVLIAGLAMGNASWLYLGVAHILPSFDEFRGLARIWFVALLPMALLAGVGTDSLLSYLGRFALPGPVSRVPGVVGSLAVIGALVLLVVTDIPYARTNNVQTILTPSTLDHTVTRLVGDGRSYDLQRNILQANAVQLQVHLADGMDPLLLEAYVRYMQRAGDYSNPGYNLFIPAYDHAPYPQPDARLLGLVNVSLVVSARPLNDPHLVQIAEVDHTLIYRNTADAGPAYLVAPGTRGNPPTLAQLQALTSTIGVHLVSQGPEQETFSFSTSASMYLVIASPAFPGWTANLDGHQAEIHLVDGVLPAIQVRPGAHTLKYTYTPTSVAPGATLSLLSLLAILAWLVGGRFLQPGKSRWFFKSAKSAGSEAAEHGSPDSKGPDLAQSDVHEASPVKQH